MLTAHVLSMPLSSGFFGTAAVENLQKAMTSLAQAASWPIANPGPVTGEVTPMMIAALGSIVQSVPGIPANLKMVLTAAFIAASFNAKAAEEAKQLVETYASELTTAITAMIAAHAGGLLPDSGGQGSGMPTSSVKAAALAKVAFKPAGVLVKAGTSAGGGAAAPGSGPFSFLPPVAPGTPWYKNWHVWAGVAGVALAGGVAYKAFS